MNKSSIYSLIALAALAVVSVGVGVYYFSSEKSVNVSADILADSSGPVAVYPLKVGPNELQNGAKNLFADSNVIDAGGTRISIYDAEQLGIISKTVSSEGKVLGKDIQIIEPLGKFTITVKNILQSPKFIPER